MKYLGDIAEDQVIDFKFSSHDATGAPTALVDGVVKVYKANATDTEATAGVTLTADFDSVTGLNHVRIDTSADAFYAIANDYSVVLTAGTVDGVSVVGTVLAVFSIENRTAFPKADYPTNFSTLGIESDGDLTKVNALDGHTAQTGDVYAKLPTNFSDLVVEPATAWPDIVVSASGTAMTITSATGGFTEDMVGRYLYLEHADAVGVAIITEHTDTNGVEAANLWPTLLGEGDLTGVRGVLGGRVLASESAHRSVDAAVATSNNLLSARLLGTIAAGTHNAQSGDGYSIASNVTHGNAALKALIDTVDTVADAIKAITDDLADGARIDLLIDAIKAKTDNLKASWNDLDAAGVRTALGMASANLDTQLGGILGYVDCLPSSWVTPPAGSDWTPTRAGYVDKLNVSGTLANTDNADTFKADVSGVPTVEQIVEGVEAEGGLLDETHTAATETIPTAIGEIEGGGLDAAGVRAALGMAEANLDEQIAGIEATVDEEALATAVASAVGEGIADEVWSNENRTLTGSSSTVGPTSATEVNDIYTTAHKNGTRRLDARVRNWDGDDILQADISSIVYTAYLLDASNPDTRTAIDGHTAVTLDKADVIFDTLQTDEYSSDYNFSHTPPIGTTNLFTIAGRDYLIEYTITPTSGEKIIVRFRVACK